MKTAVEPVLTVIHVLPMPEVPEQCRIPIFDKYDLFDLFKPFFKLVFFLDRLSTTLYAEIYLWLDPTLILPNMATQRAKCCIKRKKRIASLPMSVI